MQCEFSESCSLHGSCNSPKIRIEGKVNPDVLIISDCPHAEDDNCNSVLVGEGGELLREALRGNGFNLSKVAYTFVVKCRPTQQKWGKIVNRDPSDKEVKTCKPFVLAEIEVFKPKIILLLGSVAFKAVLDGKGIMANRGRLFEYNGIPVIPTLHPDMVIRDDTHLNPFVKDIETLWKFFTGTMPVEEKPTDYILCDTKQKLDDLIDYASDKDESAVDLETSTLNMFKDDSQIVCCSFSFFEYEAHIIPLYNKQQIFTGKMLNYAKAVLKILCESEIRKILQNGKFDIKYLEVTEGILLNNMVSDIMMKSYLFNEEAKTHALDYLVWQYVPEMGSYWDGLEQYKAEHKDCDPEQGGTYRNIPWKVMIPYVGADTDATIRIDHRLNDLLKGKQP